MSEPKSTIGGLSDKERELIVAMMERQRRWPWLSPLLLRPPRNFPTVLTLPKTLFYSRIFRLRWHGKPGNRLRTSQVSIRADFGRLEVVLDAIPKKTWRKRGSE